MASHDDARLVSRFIFLAKAASVAVALLSVLVLVGWALDIETLKSVFPGMVAMNPGGTAVSFLLGAIALWLLLKPGFAWMPPAGSGRLPRASWRWPPSASRDMRSAGTTVPTLAVSRRSSNNMQRPIAWPPTRRRCFVLCGLALLFRDVKFRRNDIGRRRFWHSRAALIALLAIIGYSYSAVGLIGIPSFIPMALNTAVAFALLERGDSLRARRPEGLMAIISSTGAGGVMARRLLPATILIPAAAGWLRWYAQQHGVVDEVMGLSLFVLANIVVFSVFIWWNAASLNRTDAELQQAKEAADRRQRRQKQLPGQYEP